MVEIVRYGGWNAYGDRRHDTVEATVLAQVRTRDTNWCTRVEKTGAFTQIVADYRAAINQALPQHVTLIDDTFYGPVNRGDFHWITGAFSLAETVNTIDLAAIVQANDPDL